MPLPQTDERLDRITDILNRLAGVSRQKSLIERMSRDALFYVNVVAARPENAGLSFEDVARQLTAHKIVGAEIKAALAEPPEAPVFDRGVAQRLLVEMEIRAQNRLLDSGVPSTTLQRAGIASRAADAIITQLEAALSTGTPSQPVETGDAVLDITADSFYQKALEINRFRDRPLRAMQLKDVLNGLVTAGITTQKTIDRITNPRLEPTGFGDPGAEFQLDAQTQAALGILANVENNWATFINAVAQQDEPDFGQAIQEVLGSDLGLDLFPALTPDEIQRQFRRQAEQDRLGLDENGNLRSMKDIVDEVFGNPASAITDRAKDVLTRTNRQLTADLETFRAGLPEEWSEEKIAAATVQELFRRKQAGDYETIAADFDTRIEAEETSTQAGALKRLTEFSFQQGVDLDTITAARKSQLARRISEEGALTPETAQGFLHVLPDLQAEKSNEDFLALTPEKRQGALLGQLSAQGFKSPFGDALALRRNLTATGDQPKKKKGSFADARLNALAASQGDFLARLDERAQRAIAANPFARLADVVRPTFRAGEAGVGLEGAAGLAAFGGRQPTMEGALPFQIPGSFSEQQQFGANPPTPISSGIPGLPQPPAFTTPVLRRLGGQPQRPQISADEARRLISGAAGGDALFESFLLENLPGAFTSAQASLAQQQQRSFERQKERARRGRTGGALTPTTRLVGEAKETRVIREQDIREQQVIGGLSNRTRELGMANALREQGVPAQQVGMLRSAIRDRRQLSLSRFIQSPERIGALRAQFEASPEFGRRLETENRRKLRSSLSVVSGQQRF